MYAIVEIAGQQFKVTKGQEIFVNRLHEDEGSKVSFDRVMLIDNDGSTKVGAPTVDGARVEATVMQHCKGNKVIEVLRYGDLHPASPPAQPASVSLVTEIFAKLFGAISLLSYLA